MNLNQSKFAALCGVTRSAVNQGIAKGHIILGPDKKLDTENPVNAAYIMRHTDPAGGVVVQPTTGSANQQDADHLPDTDFPPPPGRITREGDMPGAQESKPARAGKKRREGGERHPSNMPAAGDMGAILRTISAGQVGADRASESGMVGGAFDLSAEEMNIIARRSLFEAQKIQRDAELKALALDKEHGTLIDRDIFDAFALELMQAIQQGFIDVIPKQGLLICQRLGMVGHEAEVEDCLNSDNARRLKEVQRIVEAHLKRRYHGAAVEGVDE